MLKDSYNITVLVGFTHVVWYGPTWYLMHFVSVHGIPKSVIWLNVIVNATERLFVIGWTVGIVEYMIPCNVRLLKGTQCVTSMLWFWTYRHVCVTEDSNQDFVWKVVNKHLNTHDSKIYFGYVSV